MITKIRKNNKGSAYTLIMAKEAIEAIRSGAFADEVKSYRKEMSIRLAINDLYTSVSSQGYGIPDLCFVAQWQKKNGQVKMKEYNGLMMLEVSNLPTSDEAARIRKEVARIPYTRIAFVGITGRDVVIVCSITADGIGEKTEEMIRAIHLSAYKQLHYLYSSQLLLSLDNNNPALDRTCPMTDDADAYYNPNSQPYFVDDMEVDIPVFQGMQSNQEPQFEDNDVMQVSHIFEWCVTAAWEEAREYAGKHEIKDESMIADYALHMLAKHCNDAMIPIDYGVMHASWHRQFGCDMNYIERVFANAYEAKASKMIPYGVVNRNALMAYKLEAFLKMHYELRRNVLTGVVQYRHKNGYNFDFKDITDEALNSISNRAMKAGIGSWDKDIRRIINSNDIREYDPISEYIFSLPKWDGKDRVADIVRRIPTDTPNVQLYMRTWLLAMVAHWLGRDTRHGNALVPLLIGHQGCGKTTLCGMLLPPELSEYYNDKVNFKSETDLNLGLSSFALINIDEFDSVRQSQQPVLKYLLSKSDVKMRMPYGKAYVSRRRYASFIETTNKSHPLVDKTGSRRFACIKILPDLSIDTRTKIDYAQLYAQLSYEVFNGARYWLNEEETQMLMQQNAKYRCITDLSEMLSETFERTESEDDGQYLSTYEMIDIMEERYPELVRTARLNADIGKILRARHFIFRKRNTGMTYLVRTNH